jgi:hypothetical protein
MSFTSSTLLLNLIEFSPRIATSLNWPAAFGSIPKKLAPGHFFSPAGIRQE